MQVLICTSQHFLFRSHHEGLTSCSTEHGHVLLYVARGRCVFLEEATGRRQVRGWLGSYRTLCWYAVRQQWVRVVGQPPRVVNHPCTVIVTVANSGVMANKREGVLIAVKVPHTVVMEGRRTMLLVAGVRRDEEEWAIVEAATLVPDAG